MLVEALFSAAIVVMAFAATTLAFNASTSSATRDINKSGAQTVAQGQIEYMRSVGQTDINKLVGTSTVAGLNGTTRTVKYAGVSYTVTYTARYVDSMGGGNTDSCGSYASSGATSAEYIYMKASVSYSIPQGTAQPVTLDSYFAPEGGSSQSSTGTLKVYVLSPEGNTVPSVTSVKLLLGADSVVDTKTPNANGCVLFTGLARGVYNVSIPVGTLQDLYMTNSASTITRTVSMPARGAIVQKVELAAPVTITPSFNTMTGTTTSAPVVVSTANSFVKDTSGTTPSGAGLWIGANTNVTETSYTDYSTNPGKVFMPHFNAGTANTATQVYPDLAGYVAYPGVCTVNDPGGAAGNYSTIVAPNWTTPPTLWLTRFAPSARINTSVVNQPSPNTTNTYYWNQAFTSASVKVRLTGDNNGDAPESTDCGPRGALFNSWVTIGTITGNGATLSDLVQALPTGEYDVCVGMNYTYSKGKGSWSLFGGWKMTSVSNNVADVAYVPYDAVILPYKSVPVTRAAVVSDPTPGSTTACG